MDKLVVENKIESLRKCLLRIEARRPNTLVLNLSRAVQLSVDISVHLLSDLNQDVPDTMGLAFSKLASAGIISTELSDKLRNAVGFRNIAVHNYQDIDWEIVHSISHEKLSDFKEFVQQILNKYE